MLFRIKDITFINAIRMPGYETSTGIYANNKQQAAMMKVWYDPSTQLMHLEGLKPSVPAWYVVPLAQVKYFTVEKEDGERLMGRGFCGASPDAEEVLHPVSLKEEITALKEAHAESTGEINTGIDKVQDRMALPVEEGNPAILPESTAFDGIDRTVDTERRTATVPNIDPGPEKPKTPISAAVNGKRKPIRTGSKRK